MKCKLCKCEKPLCESHIIPEFFYKPMYDSKHRIIQLFSDKNKNSKFRQKGMRDSLLCEECEQHIAKYIETPFAKQWTRILPSYCSDPLFNFVGLDYTITKLMILTNLWRAHCSQKDDWKLVNLGPYADKIAKMIKNIDPGNAEEFPIWGQLLVDENSRVRCDLITPFAKSRPDHGYIYYSAHGGVEWFITVSPESKTTPKKECLTKSGRMVLLRKFFLQCSSFKNFRGSR